MQVTETTNEGLRLEFTVVVPKTDVESRMTVRLNEVGTSVNVPGFRPGKVPLSVLKQRFGQAVRGEVLEQTVQATVQATIEERDLRPALEPKIDLVTFEDGADLEYKLTVEIIPEIELPNFAAIKLERFIADVPDEEVDRSIERIAEQQKSFAIEDGRKAVEGDQILMNFIGRIDGEAFDGGTAEGMEIVIGSGQFIPGFEEQLTGMVAGDSKEIPLTFPDDYPAENLKSKEAVFEVDVKEIRAPAKVPIDDDFAKTMGAEDIEGFKAMVRDQIGSEYVQISRTRLKRALLDELSKRVDFDVPPGLLEGEFTNIWKQLEEAKERDQMDEDDKGKSDEELEVRYREIATRRIRLGLLLAEIGKVNELTVNQDDLNKVMGEQAQRFPGQEAQVMKYYQENPQAMQELQAPILEDKVVDYILELAQITEETVSVDELLSDPKEETVGPKTKNKQPKKKRSGKSKAKGKGKGKGKARGREK